MVRPSIAERWLLMFWATCGVALSSFRVAMKPAVSEPVPPPTVIGPAGQVGEHHLRQVALDDAGSLAHPPVEQEAVPVLHQQVAHRAQSARSDPARDQGRAGGPGRKQSLTSLPLPL